MTITTYDPGKTCDFVTFVSMRHKLHLTQPVVGVGNTGRFVWLPPGNPKSLRLFDGSLFRVTV